MTAFKIDMEVNGWHIYGDEKSVCFDKMEIDSNDGFEYEWHEILEALREDFYKANWPKL